MDDSGPSLHRPEPDRIDRVEGDGVTLHLEQFLPASPRLVLVGVHGYAAHCGLYRHAGAALARHGIAVTLFDCRGHGRSTGRRGYVRRFDEYLDDLALVVERARTTHPDLPWALMGHSQGALIALDAVLAKRLAPARLVLAAPWLALAMKVPAWKMALGRVTERLWPTLTMANGIVGEDVSRNPAVLANFLRDEHVHHVATSRWFAEALRAHARAVSGAASLTTPTLLLAAGQDRIADTAVSLSLAAASRAVEVKVYEALFHELFLEPECDVVLSDIAAWLASPDSLSRITDRSAEKDPAILPPSP